MKSSPPLRVAVVGAGHLGRQHARLYSGMDGVQLASVVDILPERAAEVAGAYGAEASTTDFRQLYGRVDAVSLAVPTSLHAEIGVELIGQGIDVLVEKPIASSVAEGRMLVDAAAQGGRVLQVGHVERFNPVVQAARELATTPQFFEVHRLAAFSPRSLDIDVVLDLMIHDLDVILSLTPSAVKEVRAVGIPVLSARADIANARVEFENGCVANLTASRVSFEKIRKLRFFQPHDYISIDYAAQKGKVVSLRMGKVTERQLDPPAAEPLNLEIASFLHAVRTRGTPAVTGEDGLRALELAARINEDVMRRSKQDSEPMQQDGRTTTK